jgi:isopenicillin N synthase-like dioxygenase
MRRLAHSWRAHSSPFRAHVARRACGAALRARARALRAKPQGESFQRVPLVDLSRLGGPNEAELVEELRHICHNVGFFYATGHGVPAQLLQRTLAVTEAFFAMPMEVKLSLDNLNSPAFRGYIVQGAENTAGVPDEREQVEFGVETDATPATQLDAPVYMRLRGPNQWPAEAQCPHFKCTMLEFMDEMEALSRRLMRLLATSLLLPPTHFDDTFGSQPNVQMKVSSPFDILFVKGSQLRCRMR